MSFIKKILSKEPKIWEKYYSPIEHKKIIGWVDLPKKTEFYMGLSNELNSYIDDFKNQNNLYHCYHFNPTEGKILVFPAHLNHLVQENKSNEDRISVSFNIRLNSGRMKRRGRVSIPRWNFNWSEKK